MSHRATLVLATAALVVAALAGVAARGATQPHHEPARGHVPVRPAGEPANRRLALPRYLRDGRHRPVAAVSAEPRAALAHRARKREGERGGGAMRASVTSSVGAPGSTRGHWAIRLPLALLELAVAVGAIYGGLEMVRHPITPLGVTPSLLAGSPFTTFTWPGLLLFLLIGIAPFLLAFGVLCKLTGAVLLSAGFGAAHGLDRGAVGAAGGPAVVAATDVRHRRRRPHPGACRLPAR